MAKVCKSDGQGTFAGTRGNGEVAPKAADQLWKNLLSSAT
jgi:hypothetical protein